jgi:uncharacterized protein YjbI with pentapeptide repeats
LSRAVIADTDLAGADLTGAYLYLARIAGADLSAAKGLTEPQLSVACGDAATRLPAGITAPSHWPCPAP